jgi:hypothetical protein
MVVLENFLQYLEQALAMAVAAQEGKMVTVLQVLAAAELQLVGRELMV